MKKNIIFILLAIFVFSLTAIAQQERYGSSRLNDQVVGLKRTTVDLVDQTSNDLRRGRNATRAEIEAAFLAAQLDASVRVFDDLVRGNNNANDLRDAAKLLDDLARRAPSYGSNSNLWRAVKTGVDNITRELGGNYGGGYGNGNNNGGGYGNNNGGNNEGRIYWSGTVDDVVTLTIRGRNLTVNTVSGRSYGKRNFQNYIVFAEK